MEFYFTLAGSVIHATGDDPAFSQDVSCLAEYLVPPQKPDREMVCRMVEDFKKPQGKLMFTDFARRVYSDGDAFITYRGAVSTDLSRAYMCVRRQGKRIEAEFKRDTAPFGVFAKDILKALEVEHIAVENSGFVLHASCVEYQGKSIVFTAPSGTGKSTQADLWNTYRGAEIINGDRIMIQSGKEGFVIRGIPFSGSSGISKNRVLPLAAIVYLHQAPENRVTPIRGMEAFKRIWEGCSLHVWNRKEMESCMGTVMQLISQVPILRLECTPDLLAVETLEAMLNPER